MNKEHEQVKLKMVQIYIQRISEWTVFVKTLRADYKLAKDGCAAQPKSQFLRRAQVRNFCALVEGQTHYWKLATIDWHQVLGAKLNEGEILHLHEKEYSLNEKGKIKERRMHQQTLSNFRFASEVFAKVFCCSKKIDFTKEGWGCVQEVFKVRDRLMHPKFVSGVEVQDNEIAVLGLADDWLKSEVVALADSMEDYFVILKNRRPPLDLN